MEIWLDGLSYKDDEKKWENIKKKLKVLANTTDNLFVQG